MKRDRAEKDALSAKQLRERRMMLRMERGRRKAIRDVQREITRDIERFRATGPPGTTSGDFSEAASERPSQEDHLESRREKSRRERPRRRRGPSLRR